MNFKEGTLAVNLPWQFSQWQHITGLHNKNTLPHAILLNGQPGIGKNRFALALAQFVLCMQPSDGNACGRCRQCMFNIAGTHPDLKILEPEEAGKQLKVDQVRQLVEYLTQTSQQGGFKIAILSPAENMNVNAANALLKSLEEPGANTLILLVSDSPSRLLPTIRSRCQLVNFPVPHRETAEHWLEGLVASTIDVKKVLDDASNQPLSALALIESDGITQQHQMSDDFLSLVNGKASSVTIAEKWLQFDLQETLVWLNHQLTLVIRHRMASTAIEPNWENVGANSKTAKLFSLCDKVLTLRNQVKNGTNPNKQLALETLMMEVTDVLLPIR